MKRLALGLILLILPMTGFSADLVVDESLLSEKVHKPHPPHPNQPPPNLPEPNTVLLLGSGLVGMGIINRYFRKKS